MVYQQWRVLSTVVKGFLLGLYKNGIIPESEYTSINEIKREGYKGQLMERINEVLEQAEERTAMRLPRVCSNNEHIIFNPQKGSVLFDEAHYRIFREYAKGREAGGIITGLMKSDAEAFRKGEVKESFVKSVARWVMLKLIEEKPKDWREELYTVYRLESKIERKFSKKSWCSLKVGEVAEEFAAFEKGGAKDVEKLLFKFWEMFHAAK